MNDTNPAQPAPSSATQNELPTAPAKPRMWMFLAWFGVIVVGMCVVLTILVIALGGGLNAQIGKLQAEGEPTSLAELKQRFSTPEGQNAAIAIAALQDEIHAAQLEIAPVTESRKSYLDPWTPEQAKTLAEFFEKHAGLMTRLKAAIRLPAYAPIIETESVDDYFAKLSARSGGRRTMARLLRLQADSQALQGDWEGAAETGLDIVRYSQHLENNPTMNEYLVALAVRQFGVMSLNDALQNGELSPAVRQRIQKEVGQVDPAVGFVEALRTERAVAIDRTRNARGSFALAQMLKPALGELERWITSTEKDGLSWQQSTKVPAATMMPTLAVHRATISKVAQTRAVRLLEALTATEQPEDVDLQSLPVPAEVREDPFAAPKPMIVKRAGGGWTVYSVGPDGVDNNGGGDDVALQKTTRE